MYIYIYHVIESKLFCGKTRAGPRESRYNIDSAIHTGLILFDNPSKYICILYTSIFNENRIGIGTSYILSRYACMARRVNNFLLGSAMRVRDIRDEHYIICITRIIFGFAPSFAKIYRTTYSHRIPIR